MKSKSWGSGLAFASDFVNQPIPCPQFAPKQVGFAANFQAGLQHFWVIALDSSLHEHTTITYPQPLLCQQRAVYFHCDFTKKK
jgi:hypothetical protein